MSRLLYQLSYGPALMACTHSTQNLAGRQGSVAEVYIQFFAPEREHKHCLPPRQTGYCVPVLRTASCPASMAGLIAVRSTRAQH